jgi:hypothetical protein
MARDEGTLPDEDAMLCETCGYILTGLAGDSNCPECGQPIADSAPQLRQLPDWERQNTPRTPRQRFWSTTAAVILHPTDFYRTLATRGDRRKSKRFARTHWRIVTLIFGLTGTLQLAWMLNLPLHIPRNTWESAFVRAMWLQTLGILLGSFLACCLLTYLTLIAATRLAARLTAWEARFRKLRLPHPVVLRGLDYHSAHYLPVAIVAFLTVAGYQLLLFTHVLDDLSGPRYLYILCTEVFLAAAYLFKTYWTAMRNMMFANR